MFAVTACRMSNYLLAQEIVSKTNRQNMALALIKYKNVLFDDETVLYQQRNINMQQKTNCVRNNNQRRNSKRKSSSGQAASSNMPIAAGIMTFSDFTETILLASEKPELIEAISDAFIHALCIEHSISLENILQLFLNYIATHIGHKGYLSSQKVFVNILQVYYYDYFDVNPLQNVADFNSNTPPHVDDYDEVSSKAASINSERDNESIANSIEADSAVSAGSSSLDDRAAHRQNRIVYNHLMEQRNSNASLNMAETQSLSDSDVETNLKGLKILFRMYLGRLKALSDLNAELQSADLEQKPLENEDFSNLRIECIKLMIRHLQELRLRSNTLNLAGASPQLYYAKNTNRQLGTSMIFVPFIPDYKLKDAEYEQHIETYLRPIPCLQERPQYLNRLPPFKASNFSTPENPDEGGKPLKFLGWQNELLTLTLKIQVS